jgi:hypothetical protein
MLAIIRHGIKFHVVLLVVPKTGASDIDRRRKYYFNLQLLESVRKAYIYG